MTDTRIHDIDTARAEAIADHAGRANRSARLQPADGYSYDEPFIEVAGAQVFGWFDEQGRLRVGVWTDEVNWPFTRPNGTVPVQIEVDARTVWTDPDEPRDPQPATERPARVSRSDWAFWIAALTAMVSGIAAEAANESGAYGWSIALSLAAVAGLAAAIVLFGRSLRREQRPDAKPTHPVDALNPQQRDALLRRVFNVLEYGNPAGEGEPGIEHDADTTNLLTTVFAYAGVRITDGRH